MKKIFLVILALVFAGVAVKAQSPADLSKLEYMKGNLYIDGQKLSSQQALAVLGQDTFEKEYKPAKGLKITGITLLATGGAACIASGAAIIHASSSKASGAEIFATMPMVIVCASGAVVAITGGILLGAGNKRMKRIVQAADGAGFALAF